MSGIASRPCGNRSCPDLPYHPVFRRFFLDFEADFLVGAGWWLYQFPDGVKDDLKLTVVFLFKFRKFPGQVGMGGQQTPQLHEGPHDGDVDLDGSFALQNT